MIFTILERDDVSVSRFPKDLQDFARKHPIVSVQNSRPRFDDNSSHRGIKVQRSTRLRNPTTRHALNALTKSKSSHSFRGFSEHGAISRTAFHLRRHAGL